MKVNLHTHTFRCGHAKGSEREYIERAIDGGITHLGFSDHAPFVFPDGHESNFRVPMEQALDYMETLGGLREEYKNDITIYIGFEMEYYQLYFKDMLDNVNSLGAEYLLLGQHFIGEKDPENNPSSTAPTASAERLTEYADAVISGMESGVFTYLAHPDMFNFWGDGDVYDAQMRRICKTSVKYGIPLEINFLGLRIGRSYPSERFWRIAGEEGCSAVFGFDAHTAKDAYDGASLPIGELIVSKFGLKLIENPCLIHPKTKQRIELQ